MFCFPLRDVTAPHTVVVASFICHRLQYLSCKIPITVYFPSLYHVLALLLTSEMISGSEVQYFSVCSRCKERLACVFYCIQCAHHILIIHIIIPEFYKQKKEVERKKVLYISAVHQSE